MTAAIAAVALSGLGWFMLRCREESARIDALVETVFADEIGCDRR